MRPPLSCEPTSCTHPARLQGGPLSLTGASLSPAPLPRARRGRPSHSVVALSTCASSRGQHGMGLLCADRSSLPSGCREVPPREEKGRSQQCEKLPWRCRALLWRGRRVSACAELGLHRVRCVGRGVANQLCGTGCGGVLAPLHLGTGLATLDHRQPHRGRRHGCSGGARSYAPCKSSFSAPHAASSLGLSVDDSLTKSALGTLTCSPQNRESRRGFLREKTLLASSLQ